MKWYEDLELKRVMEIFDEISQIPRGTGNMEGISNAVCQWIQRMGLKAERDAWNNVKAWKSATPGYENAPTIMFATHMDMVCSKTEGTVHDFTKDPIDIQLVDGDVITANGTTLGADDGMGMAFVLAILESNDIPHPAIEAIFTTDEETDMNGCLNLDFSQFKTKLVISLDGDPIGVAGAGELDTTESFTYTTEDLKEGYSCYKVSVSDLCGGHSGMESTKERGNAAMYLNRAVMAISKEIDIQLCDFVSGFGKDGRSTAFAYCADAVIAMNPKNFDKANKLVAELLNTYREELKLRDPNIQLKIKDTIDAKKAMSEKSKEKLHTILATLPDGVFTRNLEHVGLMDSSVNTGVVYFENGKVFLQTTIRSALSSRKYYLYDRIALLCKGLGVDLTLDCDLPQWDMKVPPEILALAHKIYPESTEIIEEGTSECGIFCDRMPQAAVIALECPYSGAHSTTEQISASACKKYFDRLVSFIAEIK